MYKKVGDGAGVGQGWGVKVGGIMLTVCCERDFYYLVLPYFMVSTSNNSPRISSNAQMSGRRFIFSER